MDCDIVIRTWWKDLPWTQWCVDAVDRFAHGFREVILVLPRSSAASLRRHLVVRPSVRVEFCDDVADDYLGQQVTKLYADRLTDAELICHLDSDCILSRPVAPEDLAPDGRPIIVTRSVERMGRHYPWRTPTAAFLGWPVQLDYMQRPPFVYPRLLYGQVRAHCLAVHGAELAEYVLEQSPRGFSEFNALGGFAHHRLAREFRWVDSDVEDPGPPWCRWYWSWQGLDSETFSDLEALLAPGPG